jgi:hypothetical protein
MKRTLCASVLVAVTCSVVSAQEPATVHFTIDATQDVKPISRFVYGVNRKLEGAFSDLTLTRVGGNRLTAYNWVNNASNAGNDYRFQNDDSLGGGDVPGGALIPAIDNASQHKAAIVLTVPINGYVSADKKGGGDVKSSGPDYLTTRFREEKPRKGSAFTLTPDPQSPVVFQDEFVNWVKTRFPYSQTDSDRPVFFDLDNEPDLWNSTHKEVHAGAVTYAEMVRKTIEYARAIKDVTPKAKIFGPVSYGWQGYVNLQNAPDAGKRDFLEYYLKQMSEAEKAGGKRLLDVLDVHWYPEAQGGGERVTSQGTKPAVVAARLQAPRSLWDPQYKEDSWISKWSTNGPVALLPRLAGKIARNYPGTELAITEYNYGGGKDISGGIAEADVLGILGREGVFAAAEWPLAGDERFIAGGFRMYRNFDGKGANFGDTSIHAATDDVAATSIYASVGSPDAKRLVLVAINKTDHALPAQVQIAHGRAYGRAEVYQLTAAGPEPRAAEGVKIAGAGRVDYTMPAYSVSTICLTE